MRGRLTNFSSDEPNACRGRLSKIPEDYEDHKDYGNAPNRAIFAIFAENLEGCAPSSRALRKIARMVENQLHNPRANNGPAMGVSPIAAQIGLAGGLALFRGLSRTILRPRWTDSQSKDAAGQ